MTSLPRHQKRFRMIIPAFPNSGIFERYTKMITSLGAVLVATVVDKYMPDWTVEIIDENNCLKGPVNSDGLVDHAALQQEDPADAVGFYCGLSSTIPRVWELTRFYKSQNVFTIAGGWHVRYAPEESLEQGLDAVVTGDGEEVILDILNALDQGQPMYGQIDSGKACLEALPIPDFGLLRFARLRVYPIGRIRGCSMACEFCSVKDKPRWSQPEYLYNVVKWLVETRQAKSFFITDDRLEEDKEGYTWFFNKIAEQYGRRVRFTVQVRLAAIKDEAFVQTMKRAGVKHVCIGLESPIDEELKSMHKGIRVKTMIEQTRQWAKHFYVHGMFIFGYPMAKPSPITYEERIKSFKRFIRKSKIDTIQILRPVPLIGSQLRDRLEQNGQLIPLEEVGWEYYDGNYACFNPTNMTLEELQWGPTTIMIWYYNWYSFIKLPLKTISLPLWYPITGWSSWYRRWWKEVVKAGAYRLLLQWKTREEHFLARVRSFFQKRAESSSSSVLHFGTDDRNT